MSFKMLLAALALTLLVVTVESSSGGDPPASYSYDLETTDLAKLYESPVLFAERMKRPLAGTSNIFGPISHSGVRVTLQDGSRWLVHKGDGYGISSQTVVTDARHMSSSWVPVETRDFQGSKKVFDFVREGGTDYDLFWDNCHLGSRRMMKQ